MIPSGIVVTKELTKIGSARPPVPKFGLLTPTVVMCDPADGNPTVNRPPPPPRPPRGPVPPRPLLPDALGGI